MGRIKLSMVPGHEIIGIVSGIGSKVTRYKVCDRVGVGCFVDSCRKCEPCRKGLEQYCIEGPTLTYNALEKDGKTPTQGGYSEKIVVDENYTLSIPDNLPSDRAHLFYVQVLPCIPLLCIGKLVLEKKLE